MAAGLLGLALLPAGGLARWVGVAIGLVLLVELRSFPKVTALVGRLARFAPYALVAALFIGLFADLLLGRPPASRDHGIHYFQTHLLVHELLPSGRLWGWTDAFNNGYPFGENYPVLGYLVTGAAHVLSFEAVPLRTSYAWGLAFVWAIGAIGVWWLAALVTREAGLPRASAWAGAVGAALWLLDAGASRQGGWNYAMFHGVWPQQLSAALWVLSLPLTWRALQAPTPRRICAAGLALGASILAHPFGLLAAATSGGGWVLALLLRRRDDDPLPRPFAIWAAVHGFALLACGWWLAVFFGSAEAMSRSPVPWRPLGRISVGALTGELFDSHWAWFAPLFLLGAIAIVRRGSALGLACLGLVLALLLLAANEALTILRLDLLVSGFKNLQFPRYAIEVKPVMFAVAGFGAVGIPAALRALAARDRDRPSRRRTVAIALVLAPFATTAVEDIGRVATRPVGAIDILEGSRFADDDAELLEALRAEKDAMPEGTPMRVAFLRNKMSSATYALFAITDAEVDLIVDGHVPAVNFRHQVRRRVKGYRRLGVTHVVHDRKFEDTETAFANDLEQIDRFGRFRLARFRTAAYSPSWILPDVANVELTRIDETGIDATVTGLTRKAKLTLLRAPHVRWSATWRGEPIDPVEPHSKHGVTATQFEIESDGELQLRYEVGSIERGMGWVSLAIWVLGLLALASGRELQLSRAPVSARVRRGLVVAALVLVVVVAWFAMARQRASLEATWVEAAKEIGYSRADSDPTFVRDLVEENALAIEVLPEPRCHGLLTRDVGSGCTDVDLRPHLHTLYRAPYLYRCLEFTVPPKGTARVQLGSGGHDVVGTLLRREEGTTGEDLRFGIAFAPAELRTSKRDYKVDVRHNATGAIATIENDSRNSERFCISAAEVDPP